MKIITSGIIIIGNEILSGRTKDINTNIIAKKMSEIGIKLLEVRSIPDNKSMIIEAVKSLKDRYDYVFTTGGIGPTHDDITSNAIASAFNVELVRNEEIYQLLLDFYQSRNESLNDAREKMSYIPRGAKLLGTNISLIPGFYIDNVFTLAGIPTIMESMLESCIPILEKGDLTHTKSLDVMIGESQIADELIKLQNKYTMLEIGSYPFYNFDNHGTTLVISGTDEEKLKEAFAELKDIVS